MTSPKPITLDIAALRERLGLFLAMPGDMEHPAGYPRLLSINREEARVILAALSPAAAVPNDPRLCKHGQWKAECLDCLDAAATSAAGEKEQHAPTDQSSPDENCPFCGGNKTRGIHDPHCGLAPATPEAQSGLLSDLENAISDSKTWRVGSHASSLFERAYDEIARLTKERGSMLWGGENWTPCGDIIRRLESRLERARDALREREAEIARLEKESTAGWKRAEDNGLTIANLESDLARERKPE